MLHVYKGLKMLGILLVFVGIIFIVIGEIRNTKKTNAEINAILESQGATLGAGLRTLSTELSTLKEECIVKIQDLSDLQLDHDNMIKAHDVEIMRLKEKTRAPK